MEIDAHAARRLFQAVVSQALVDAVTEIPAKRGRVRMVVLSRKIGEPLFAFYARRRKALVKRITSSRNAWNSQVRTREEARNWLTRFSPDFQEIVSLAGYNPDDIHERALNLKQAGWPRRPLPGPEREMALAA